MTGYRFDVTCARCGGTLEHVAAGTPGIQTSAVARCDPCRIEWVIAVAMRPGIVATGLPPGGGRDPARCGTDAGYTSHRRQGELPCLACMEAARAAKRERRARSRTPEVVC